MSITRDPEYPAEFAQLMEAFNRVAEGSSAECVLNASVQMLSAAIQFHVREDGMTLEQAQKYTDLISALLLRSVQENYRRQSAPSDVAVKPQ